MSRSFWLAAMTAAFLATVSLSASAAKPGWYIGAEAGASFLDDAQNKAVNTSSGTGGGGSGPGGVGSNCVLAVPPLAFLICSTGSGSGGTGGPGGGGSSSSSSFTTEYDTGFLGGLTLGYLFPSGLRPEVELRYAENDIGTIKTDQGSADGKGDIASIALMGNLWFNFNQDGNWHPYIGAGVGVAKLDLDLPGANAGSGFQADDTVFAYQGGVGISYDLTEKTVIDLGYRYFATDDPEFEQSSAAIYSEYTQQVALLSLRYTFAPAEPPDSDADGVPDARDQCPNTPKGVPVNAQGCPRDDDGDGVPGYKDQCPGTPAGIPVNQNGCPRDSDGDGVPDYKDECPNTAAGVKVDASGCPRILDSDGDGVPDDMDKCPNTPPGVPVLTNGCAKGQSLVLDGVKFEFDSAQLTPSAQQILLETVKVLKDSPGFRVKVAGHTDAIGSASYNQRLSARRAQSVKTFLVNHGIDPSRLETIGYGETRPIAPNDTEVGRAKNRRVELHIIDSTKSATRTTYITIPIT